MKRAAVCIGVARTGGLRGLDAARQNAKDMHEWALGNDIDSHLITDEEAAVTVDQLKKTIKALIDQGTIEQLIIYFSGHGVNIRREEHWLLSGAPEEDEAVNVSAAETRARYSGVPHVVFLSDACRTAPQDTQNQSIEGHPIFPNFDYEGPENKVDIFWACTLGAPSLEIKDPDDSAKRHAVFTDELLKALKGSYPDILVDDVPPAVVLRPWPLHDMLVKRVPERISQILGSAVSANQQPDSRINSRDRAYLAHFDARPVMPAVISFESAIEVEPPAPSIAMMARDVVLAAVSPNRSAQDALTTMSMATVRGAKEFAAYVTRESEATGPDKFESRCGFKFRGAAVRETTVKGARVERVDNDPSLIRIWPTRPAHNALFELEDGRAIVLPAIHEFIATVSFEDGELRNVAYEPSSNSPLWREYVKKKDELTVLRSVIAASANVGGFRIGGDDALNMTERIRYLKGTDPTMALYAAYSYHNLGRRDLIRMMQTYLLEDMRATLFDVAMMASDKTVKRNDIFPFVPMLAQGWSLIDAFEFPIPPSIKELKRHVGTSLWTIFDAPALPTLRRAMKGQFA
jgi:caspase domain-containing protein